MKIIKENEYFQVGETIFQYIIVDGKHKQPHQLTAHTRYFATLNPTLTACIRKTL